MHIVFKIPLKVKIRNLEMLSLTDVLRPKLDVHLLELH
jgi:hypothetical protein